MKTAETIRPRTGIPQIFNDEVVGQRSSTVAFAGRCARLFLVGCVELSIPGRTYRSCMTSRCLAAESDGRCPPK
ncbi:pyruvate formate lyase family protein [Escherichia coli]